MERATILRMAQYDVAYCQFDGGHRVPACVVCRTRPLAVGVGVLSGADEMQRNRHRGLVRVPAKGSTPTDVVVDLVGP
jgi:hypothetical protein